MTHLLRSEPVHRKGCGRLLGLCAALLLAASCAAAADTEPGGLNALRRAAEAGDAHAQNALAHRYLSGTGVAVDVERGMQWLCRAVHHASGGEQTGRALWFLATYFRTGGGVPGGERRGERARADPIRAYFWFSVQAEQSRLFETALPESELLGRLGRAEIAPLLYPEERARVDEAVRRWTPARPVASGRACLALPATPAGTP